MILLGVLFMRLWELRTLLLIQDQLQEVGLSPCQDVQLVVLVLHLRGGEPEPEEEEFDSEDESEEENAQIDYGSYGEEEEEFDLGGEDDDE